MIHILLVEDNRAHAEIICGAFEPQGESVRLTVVHTLQTAHEALNVSKPDLIIANLRLPDGQGVELLPAERAELSYPVVIMTSSGDEQVAVEAIKTGALDYVVKSDVTLLDLPRIAERALREWDHITERQRSEQTLGKSEECYALAARAANDGLWDWDMITNTIYFFPRWKTMLGWEEEAIGNTLEEWYKRVHSEDIGPMRKKIADHLEGHTPYFEGEYRMLHKDRSYRWMLCRGLTVRDTQGKAYRMAGSQTDITDRKVAKEQLFYVAAHDPLTDLANYSLFLDHLGQALQRTKRYSDEKFAVLFLDLDHFKVVNDSLGHKIGDSLLIEFSRRLKKCLRPVDTAARLGGDEFTILLDRITTVQDVVSVVKRIQAVLTVPFQLHQQEVFMTASIGITLSSPSYEYPDDVLRDADTAMYRAKSAGRAQYVIFDKSMHTRATERLRLETELRRAIKQQEFQVHYQPIISLPRGQISGAEGLLRWYHPQRGLIPPMEFIPLAEETGLIIPISEWLIRTVCTQQKSWQEAGYPPIILAINISMRDLQCPDLAERVEQILAETEVAADTIELEITETTVMNNIHSSLETLKDLSHLGIRISIDDFGTGHSSLGRLKHLPIQTLKIDQSFIHDMANNPDDETLTKAIIAMAQGLKLEVIAEGVETNDQLSFLQAQRCDKLQGFLFSRPLPVAEFTRLLHERRRFVVPAIS